MTKAGLDRRQNMLRNADPTKLQAEFDAEQGPDSETRSSLMLALRAIRLRMACRQRNPLTCPDKPRQHRPRTS